MSRLVFAKVSFRGKTWTELNSRDLLRELARWQVLQRRKRARQQKLSAFGIIFVFLFSISYLSFTMTQKRREGGYGGSRRGWSRGANTKINISTERSAEKARSKESDQAISIVRRFSRSAARKAERSGREIVFKMRCDKKMWIHVCVAWLSRSGHKLPPPPRPTPSVLPPFLLTRSLPFKWKYNHYLLLWPSCVLVHCWFSVEMWSTSRVWFLCRLATTHTSAHPLPEPFFLEIRLKTLASCCPAWTPLVHVHPRQAIFIIARYGQRWPTNTTTSGEANCRVNLLCV